MKTNTYYFLLLTLVVTLRANQGVCALMVDAGDHLLLPDASDQVVSFFVTGGDPVNGLEFDIQISDGTEGPLISSIDLISATIFDVPSANQVDVETFPRMRQSTVDIVGTVTANDLIATVVFDTSGLSGGSYPLLLSGVAVSFNTTFFDQAGTALETLITNGSLTVIPEPRTVWLSMLAIAGLVASLRLVR